MVMELQFSEKLNENKLKRIINRRRSQKQKFHELLVFFLFKYLMIFRHCPTKPNPPM